MFQKFKNFLTATPIQFNGKPFALWKLLLPLTLLIMIPLTTFAVKQVTRPLTPEEIAVKEYQKSKEQAEILSQKVAKETEVPTDETPNVATIEDVTKLQNQEFFRAAKNGDKILIYEKKKIIVLYRPSEERVIATAPVLYNQPTPAIAGTSSAQTTASTSAQLPGVQF
jgi:hypothetical protein